MSERWLSAGDVAEHSGVSKELVYVWIANKGRLAHKVWRLWKVQAREVDVWLRCGGARTVA